ncbi:MAG: GntR family transcriptional regulator [Lachnoclostridium sp.]|jgi:DNA-binding transcriptional regulator YhcF (GntR family)|nr:GntR family transcriptional regulator [Lachnoclostridium sp.]
MSWKLSSDRPIYVQLEELIEKRILSGEYILGERFPSVRDLANEASVNPNTMQKAMQELERKGLIINNRTLGRTLTEDSSLLEDMRIQLAKKHFRVFLDELKSLGYSEKDLPDFIHKECHIEH